MFKLFVIALLGAVAVGLWLRVRKGRQLQGAALLAEVAQIFEGKLLPARRDESWGTVHFGHGGFDFKLKREERLRENAVEPCCVVEAAAQTYGGPALELLSHGESPSRLLPQQREVVDTGVEEWRRRVTAYADPSDTERLQAVLADKELRRVVGYALDKKGARLHLSDKGIWFECAGFPDNRELVAAVARTAAEAIAQLLQRAAA